MLDGQEEKVSPLYGAFVLGMIAGNVIMFVACHYFGRPLQSRDAEAAQQCRAAQYACVDAAIAAENCK